MGNANRHGTERETVHEVGRSVQRIGDPHPLLIEHVIKRLDIINRYDIHLLILSPFHILLAEKSVSRVLILHKPTQITAISECALSDHLLVLNIHLRHKILESDLRFDNSGVYSLVTLYTAHVRNSSICSCHTPSQWPVRPHKAD